MSSAKVVAIPSYRLSSSVTPQWTSPSLLSSAKGIRLPMNMRYMAGDTLMITRSLAVQIGIHGTYLLRRYICKCFATKYLTSCQDMCRGVVGCSVPYIPLIPFAD